MSPHSIKFSEGQSSTSAFHTSSTLEEFVSYVPKLDVMKHLMTLAALLVSTAFVAQVPWPYNPDADGDNVIGIEDLMSLLVVYNTDFYVEYPASEDDEFTLAMIKADSSVITYVDCLRFCALRGGHIITTTDLALFEDEVVSSSEWQGGGVSSCCGGLEWENYYQEVFGYSSSNLGVSYDRGITVYPDGFDYSGTFVAVGDTVWSNWDVGSGNAQFGTSSPDGRKGPECFCAGTIHNPGFQGQ